MGRFLLMTAFLSLALPALAGEEQLTPHERELLLARLEDLAGRLAAGPGDQPPAGFERRQSRLEVELTPQKGRALGGVALVRTGVTLKGSPDLVLAWLGRIRESRLAITPPYHLRALGDEFETKLSLWRVQGDRPDPKSPDSELIKLKQNLEWFESQKEKLDLYITFLQPILYVEAIAVSEARLEKGVFTIAAEACDRTSKEAFEKELSLRAKKFGKKPRLDLEGLVVRPSKPVTGSGLHMRDLDPGDAMLLACEVDRAQIVARWKNTYHEFAPQSGHVPTDGGKLLSPLLRKLSLPTKNLGVVQVASRITNRKPPDAGMFPKRPITLSYRKVSPQNLFVLLSDVSRVGVIPPGPESAHTDNLTVLVRDMPIRNLVSAVLWALLVAPIGDKNLVAFTPPGYKISKPKEAGAATMSLSASDAPLSMLVEALSGESKIVACWKNPALTLRVRDVAKDRLLDLLLAGQWRTLKREGNKTYLKIIGRAGLESCNLKPGSYDADRLYAVMRGEKESLALLVDGGRLRWVAEGEKLQDGREVRRVRTSRVVLKATDGKVTSLTPHPEPDCPPAGCPLRFDPTATPLGRFRLAGTAVTEKRAAAAMTDDKGNVYLVRQGHLVGRRCGRVTQVLPGKIRVEMGCAQGYDAKEIEISLSDAK